MPCDRVYRERDRQRDEAKREQNRLRREAAEREQARLEAEIAAREAALKELEKQLAAGKVTLIRDFKTGQVKIVNFDRTACAQAGWHDSCVLAAIAKRGTFIAKAKLEEKLKEVGSTSKKVIEAHDHEH